MSKILTIPISCLFLLIAAVPLAAVQLDTKEVQLAALPDETIVESRLVSPDCKRVAFVNRDASGSWVVVDGVASEKYARVAPPLLFSPDSKRLGYVAVAPERLKSFVVVDGKEWPAVERLAWTYGLRFSPNSKHLAFVCGRGEQNCVMLDGVLGQGYINLRSLEFSPDGERLAYVAVPRAGKELLVVDGTAGAEYERVDGAVFSADGKHVACVCTRGDKRLVVLDGKEQKPYPYIAFIGSVEPGRESKAVTKALFFSPDGNRLVYFAGTPDRWRLVEGELEGEEFQSGGGRPVFSPDSHNLAFRADRDERPFIVVNGAARALEGKAMSVDLDYSPDGKRLAHIVVSATGRMRMVVDGLAGAEWDAISANATEEGDKFWFSPDSQHLAYVAERGFKWCLVRDGVEGKPYHGIAAVRFSPDSKHLAYLAYVAAGRKVVIDGAEVPMKVTDQVIAGLRWENASTCCTAVQRGRSVVRFEATAR